MRELTPQLAVAVSMHVRGPQAATSTVVIVLVSSAALGSWQVDRDIFQAFTTEKAMVPVLIGITHEELRNRHRDWVLMFGAATWLSLPPDGVSAFIPRLVQGLKTMGAEPTAPSQ